MSLRKTCGSELARDAGHIFNAFIDCHTAIASKLAPTIGFAAKRRQQVHRFS
jgi:hypothetical protein